MAIEVELPQEIELKIRANKDLDLLVRKRLEHQIKEDLKNDLFITLGARRVTNTPTFRLGMK